jgi:hypothetical protein
MVDAADLKSVAGVDLKRLLRCGGDLGVEIEGGLE